MNKSTTNTREKILATAEQLIYQNGIHATGMDLLVKTSGVARKSIYRYFANKDEVAAAALNARDVRWMEWFRAECDKADTPQERILNMFTVLKVVMYFATFLSGKTNVVLIASDRSLTRQDVLDAEASLEV
jgi:AcrR family transcriptional regulator